MNTTLLVLTLNEIEGIRQIMSQIKPEWVDQILVLDGGSTDGTIEYAKVQGYDIHVQTRKGIRFTYLEALDKIKREIVISFSPDGNSPPEVIPKLKEKMKEGNHFYIRPG